MAVRVERFPERLPYGIGRFTGGWYALTLILLAVLGWGVFAYSRELAEGLSITGMRDIGTMGGATWGVYIALVVYFVGVSFAGITVAALIRLLNLEWLRPISRMAELLTVLSLILAALAILLDLGKPLRGIVNLFVYARPQSPFFGTFTLVISGYLFASLVYFYLAGRRDAALCAERSQGALQKFYRIWAAGYRDTPEERERHRKTSFWLAIAILPLLVTAHSTLGFVFGLQIGRPGWFSALQAPGFVVLAGVSGLGLLILIAAILRGVLGVKEELGPDVFKWLANFLMLLTLTYLYFLAVEWLTVTYEAHHHEVRLSTALLTGEFAWLFWLTVALLVASSVLLLFQFLTGRYRLWIAVLCGVLVNFVAIGKRYLLVVPSQTHGTLLPYGAGSYAPTWVEYSNLLGLFALGTLLYVIFVKVFPILEVPESLRGGE